MKVLGFCPIYYGIEYLAESLGSIVNHCDKVVVAYTHNPSHGHNTSIKCPDTREEIYSIASHVLGDKLIWDEQHSYPAENSHRNQIHKYSHGYDLILSIDADEVYKEEDLKLALEYAFKNGSRYYGLKGYINFWKSFNHACYDGFRPIRIENLHNINQSQDLNCPLTVYHFSTAQSEKIMRFKYSIFGHANEIKPNWLDQTYFGWDKENNYLTDVHCVAYNIWNPSPFDKNILPESLKNHPNYNKDVI